MKYVRFVIAVLCVAAPFGGYSQATRSAFDATRPPADSWPTYHGDDSGRHFSPLTQVNSGNVKGLSLAWVYRVDGSTQGAIPGGTPPAPAPPRPQTPPEIAVMLARAGSAIKSIPLAVDGVLYFTVMNHVYAVDARSGIERWHYVWQGRSAPGNRGLGIAGKWLFLETPDNNLASLDAQTGKERWHRPMASEDATNFSSSAPLVIRNHVIAGVGGDSGDNSGWVESRDPETGELQWRWYVTPREGEPGLDTWPNTKAASLGAGAPWQPPTYDPELNLLYVPTGNPTPSFNGHGREGANLYTCSVVALNPDTGKVVWYYQFSPHDTHDWDSTQVPVLIDGVVDGQARKLMAVANRNGYYFLLDRTNGKSLVVKPLISTANGYKGIDDKGVLIPEKAKEPSQGGSLVSPDSDGATNYPAPSYSPDTGLFYVNATTSYSLFYLSPEEKGATGFATATEYHSGLFRSALKAIDYKTGKVQWEHQFPELNGFWSSTYPGVLSTQGGLLFSGDPSGNFFALDAKTGHNLWHAFLGTQVTNTPETFLMDSKQYIVAAAGDSLYAFYLQ